MGPQRRGRVVVAGQLRLGQRGVDFPVADVMQEYGWPALAAFELWDEVVQALRRVRWNRTVAEGADRVGQWYDPLQNRRVL